MYIVDQEIAHKIVKEHKTPVFVTDAQYLTDKVKELKEVFGPEVEVFYAMKANSNPGIIKTLKKAGVNGVDVVSYFEVLLAKKLNFTGEQILFTGNNLSTQEMLDVHREKVILNIGSVSELKRFAEALPGEDISIRINPEIGDGEFKQIITGGKSSKFGILSAELPEASKLIKKHSLNVIGLHCHIGSGLYTSDKFEQAVDFMLQKAEEFPYLSFIDFGGGFGVSYRPQDKPINIQSFASYINKGLSKLSQKRGIKVRGIIEPGKFLVAGSTCLLATVTTIRNGHEIPIIGVDTGMNHLIRPALYGSYHHIVNVSNPGGALKKVKVVGNICESTDVFCENIELANPEEGDILAFLTAGAYCASMSSLYNLRPYADEVIIDGDIFYKSRVRPDFDSMMEGMGYL